MKSVLNIPSDIRKLYEVRCFVLSFFEVNNIGIEYFNKVILLISEAVNNSIMHGNGNNYDKKVSITLFFDGVQLKIEICDEGNGFDFLSISDPTDIKHIKKEKGRGVFIIKSLSDFFEFCDGGKRLVLKCNLF